KFTHTNQHNYVSSEVSGEDIIGIGKLKQRDFTTKSDHISSSENASIINATANSPSITHVQKVDVRSKPQDIEFAQSTASVEPNITLDLPTNPTFSRFTLKSIGQYQLCDTLEITIEARDVKNKVKTYGGDYFWIWIYNKELRASAAADDIIDHQNGTYTARFQLHWTGVVKVSVLSLIHSSEAIVVLRRIRNEFPARWAYKGRFKAGNAAEIMSCHITEDMYFPPTAAKASVVRKFCNFTDGKTGFPWFCEKPKQLSHAVHITSLKAVIPIGLIRSKIQRTVVQLTRLHLDYQSIYFSDFFSPVLISASIANIPVKESDMQISSSCDNNKLPRCSLGIMPRPKDGTTGFYYHDKWNSLVCKNREFTIPEIRKCLQNQRLHFWGDSTLRQWYEYFASLMKSTLVEQKAANSKFGPHVAVDKAFNISFFYRHHGFPIRNSWTPVKDIHYVPNMIDELQGDNNEIVLLSLWAHFTASNEAFYRNRWQGVKDSILRLKARNPRARIIMEIKSANTREPAIIDNLSWSGSWYAWTLDQMMRRMMLGVDGVTIIDVWDMTIGHRTGVRIHPLSQVISQEIGMLLSFLCPDPS
ncbi:NXPE family member 3-like, partial [Amphiura filiformis]|uniref:NXPE family member 3-like n=1 Tax=Amphiura filiformis TaxID=82378 RepID=UPI003B2254F1